MMPAMRAMAVSTAALEASTAAIAATIRTTIRATIWTTVATTVTVASAMGTIGAPVGASAASAESSAITAAIASTALRALESGTRIGADAGKILARRVRIARAAGFPWQKHRVIFDDSFDSGTLGRGCGRHGLRRNVLDGFVVSKVGALGFGQLGAVFFRASFLARFGLSFCVAGFRGELGFVGFFFRIFAVFAFFPLVLLLFGFFFVVAVLFVLCYFVRFVEGFRFILIKICATDERVGFRASLRLFVLGFHQAGGERDSLFIAKAGGAIANRPGWGLLRVLLRGGGQGFLSGFRGVLFRGGFPSGRIGFRFRIG